MLRILKKDGFASLIEVIVTTVIFVLAALGIFTTTTMLRPHGVASSQKLEAAYIGKRKVEELEGKVDARMWDNTTSPIYPGSHNEIISGMYGTYNVIWEIGDATGYRTLNMSIDW